MSARTRTGNRWEVLCRVAPLALFTLGLVISVATAPARAQDETVVDDRQLWREIVDRFEVVVLSRGILLEPLEDTIQLRMIEIGDEGIAIDGRWIEQEELAERLGPEEVELLTRLAAMDEESRRRLFETSGAPLEPPAPPAPPAPEAPEAEPEDLQRRQRQKPRDSQVVVGDSLTIEADEVAKEAVVFGGSLTIYGKVLGDAAAIGGSITVEGEVIGDVVAVAGNVVLRPGAEVMGDAVSVGGHVERDPGAEVMGQVIAVPFGPDLRFGDWSKAIIGRQGRGAEDWHSFSPWWVATEFMWEVFGLVVVALFACLALLMVRRPMERIYWRAAIEPWKSGLVGLVAQILFLPLIILVILVLIISIIGIPLLLLVPFAILALCLIAFVGYCGVAFGLGRFLENRFDWRFKSPYLVLLLGLLAVHIWSLIAEILSFSWGPLWAFAAMFGIFGILVKYAAFTVGFGSAILTRFGSAERWGGQSGGGLPPVPPLQSEGDDAAAPPQDQIQPSGGPSSWSEEQSEPPPPPSQEPGQPG